MKKDILTILFIATVGFGAWVFMSSHDVTDSSANSDQAVVPEMLDENPAFGGVSEELESPPAVPLDSPALTVSGPAAAEDVPAASISAPTAGSKIADADERSEVTDSPALSDLEREIMEVLANAHAVHDNYQRADAEIEAKLDVQVREALERRAITAREAPEFRDYLRQIAIEDRAREQQDYEPDTPAVGGIFADRSLVTEE